MVVKLWNGVSGTVCTSDGNGRSGSDCASDGSGMVQCCSVTNFVSGDCGGSGVSNSVLMVVVK